MHAYLQHGAGTVAPARVTELWWQTRGLSFTASGYGSRIPTAYMVQFEGVWRRVYCRIYSNIGTCYIFYRDEKIIVGDIE